MVPVKNIKNAAAETRKAMKTIVAKVDLRQASSAEVIQTAAKILQEGGLVAFPTETVYGLGGNGLDSAACEKIYLAKGRPSDNPLILHISEIEELDRIVAEVSPQAKALMDAFWPGPLTMIFRKKDIVPAKATGGLDTVAVRFPNHPVARAIIRAAGLPIAAPSANSSGKPSPTRASHVEYDLNGKIDMIVDGGAAEWGLESTIVDVSGPEPIILRPGYVTQEMLEKVLGEVARALSSDVRFLSSEKRKNLHLAAVFACNFTNHMYALAEKILEEQQIPGEVLLPLIDETAAKVHVMSPARAQTGPAIRYDENVINKHMAMLKDPDMRNLYELISRSIHKEARHE